jgi:hypothetical protein
MTVYKKLSRTLPDERARVPANLLCTKYLIEIDLNNNTTLYANSRIRYNDDVERTVTDVHRTRIETPVVRVYVCVRARALAYFFSFRSAPRPCCSHRRRSPAAAATAAAAVDVVCIYSSSPPIAGAHIYICVCVCVCVRQILEACIFGSGIW